MQKRRKEEMEKEIGCEITSKVKYLGIILSMKNLDLFKNNYEKTWEGIQNDLKKWDSLKLSLLGRTASVKMNVLPWLMFLF